MQRVKPIIAMLGVIILMGCSSYVKQPEVCIDRWYGYALDGGCPATMKKAAAPDASQEMVARLAALEGDRERLADELEAAQRENGVLSNRVSELERQLADQDRELAGLRSGSDERDTLASQLFAVQSDKDRLAAESAAANQRIVDLERQLDAANRRVADLEGQLAAAESAQPPVSPVVQLETAKQGLIRALRSQIEKGDIEIDLNGERLLIKLASSYLFESGEAQLKPGGVKALRKVGEVLKEYPEYNVAVEGHTDDRPLRSTLKKKFASNQELSDARAAHAAKALEEGGLSNLATAGFADTKPVASNRTEAGRAKNRRVEVRVTK
jgi:chemotaxis protein MotB